MVSESQHFGGVKITHYFPGQSASAHRRRCQNPIAWLTIDRAHRFYGSCRKRYTTKRFVDLSGMNGSSLPNEVQFNHAPRFRLEESSPKGAFEASESVVEPTINQCSERFGRRRSVLGRSRQGYSTPVFYSVPLPFIIGDDSIV